MIVLFLKLFFPKKGRQTRLEKIAQEERTIILYESPHKLLKTLGQWRAIVEKIDRFLFLEN